MSLFKLSRERIGALETALLVPAVLALAKAVGSVYGVMCDPTIKVAGAPPFGFPSIYGVPVWFLALLFIGASWIVIDRKLPGVSRFIARYRLAVFIGCIVLAVVLPMLPFPNRILGACRS